MKSQWASRISRHSLMHDKLPTTPIHTFAVSNSYPNSSYTDEEESDEEQEEDEDEQNFQYYTIPAQKKIDKSPLNVVEADYGVFESKRKKKNILKGLFKRRETNAWQDDKSNNPMMILRPEPELVSDNENSSDGTTGSGNSEKPDEGLQIYSADMEPGQQLEHITRRQHTFVDNRGHLNEIIDERILKRSKVSSSSGGNSRISGRSSRTVKTKIEAQFASNENQIRKAETLRHRRQQAEKMKEYERFFVNGIDSNSKQKKRSKRNQSKFTKQPSSSFGDSLRETIDTFNRVQASLQMASMDGFRSKLLSPKTALEFHRSTASCISALPFGNIAKPFLFLLSSLILNPKSKEGSYLATLVATLSAMLLISFCLATYKLFKLFWPILTAFIKFANILGFKI